MSIFSKAFDKLGRDRHVNALKLRPTVSAEPVVNNSIEFRVVPQSPRNRINHKCRIAGFQQSCGFATRAF